MYNNFEQMWSDGYSSDAHPPPPQPSPHCHPFRDGDDDDGISDIDDDLYS